MLSWKIVLSIQQEKQLYDFKSSSRFLIIIIWDSLQIMIATVSFMMRIF